MAVEQSVPVVAIDGPVGVGKSTVARRVAADLGFRHLDTGAMYRAVALLLMRQAPGTPADEFLSDPDLAGQTVRAMDLDLREDGAVILAGEDVSADIRDESISRFVSFVADCMEVRRALVEQQRRLGLQRPAVLEGRDIGTVVFPDAGLKIYLDASPKVRRERRCDQLDAMGRPADREAVLKSLMERDARDRARPWGALRVAPGARLIDTTHFTEDMVVSLICAMVRESSTFEELLITQ